MHIPMTFDTIKKLCLGVGVLGAGASVYMTWKFGMSQSPGHAASLVGVTLMAAFVFPARKFIMDMTGGKYGRALLFAGIACLAGEWVSDMGYTMGVRDKQQVEAKAQTGIHNAVFENLDSEKTNIALWRKQLADLQAQHAWAATVKADGMRDELANLKARIEDEKKGKRGRGAGCGKECERLQNEAAALSAKIGIAEQASKLAERIEKTQNVIAKATAQATETKIGHSTASAQNGAFAKGALLLTAAFGNGDAKAALHPDDVSQTIADLIIGIIMASLATFLPALCFFIAFFGGETKRADEIVRSEPARTVMAPAAQVKADTAVEIHEPAPMQTVIRPQPQMIGTAILTRIAGAHR